MKYMKIVTIIVVVLLCGCQPGVQTPVAEVVCPGRATIGGAAQSLNQQRAKAHPIRASVEAVLEWTEEGRLKSERIDGAQLIYVPADRLFLRGDKFGEIRFGTNPEAFWLMIKPELDSYWWGSRRAGQECTEALQFDPWHVVEALGAVQVDTTWTLEKEPGYDVLVRRGPTGAVRQKIWVQACSYLIERTEIYPASGNEIIRILQSDYRITPQGYAVASNIRIEHYRGTEVVGTMQLELNNIQPFEAQEARMQRLFERPSAKNYENVYRLTETCEFIRE